MLTRPQGGFLLRTLSVILLAALLAPAVAGKPADLPPLIPREILFGNPVKQFPTVSPDGTRIAYLAPDKKNVLNVFVKTIGRDDDVQVTHDPKRGVGLYRWAGDSRHILYQQDSDGDENWHVYSADLGGKLVRDLTPFQGVRASNLMVSYTKPNEILVGLNLRDPRVFDMYRIDLETGAVRLDTENPGDVLSWTTDANFTIRAATVFKPSTAETVLRVRDAAGQPWRDLIVWPFEESGMFGQINGGSVVAGFSADGRSLYVVSALGRDTAALVEVDARTGKELKVLASHPKSDVAEDPTSYPDMRPLVMTSPVTNAVQAVGFEYETWEWQMLDPDVRRDFAVLSEGREGFVDVISRDRADKIWVVGQAVDNGPTRYWLYDRNTRRAQFLFADQPALEKYTLARAKPLVITARDGLPLVSYLWLPPGVEPKKLPLILLPHGGPWARDSHWFDPLAQLLTNRGYAVLQVNFRGSTGFGKKFLNAGNHQIGLGMQEDLHDGVRWAIKEGIADPKRLGVMGGSMGGYATLRAISTEPDMFACAVDIVGPSDLSILFTSMPSYWAPVKVRWTRRMGDVEHDAALNRKLSPLYSAERIRTPLLVGQGANDPRVNIKNSDLIVAALRERKVPVTYIVYPDEGHGFARPENSLDFFGRVEEFLAKHLGGRAEPWKKMEGSSAELR